MGWERWVPSGDDKRSFALVFAAAAVVVVVVATVVDVKVSFVPASAVLAAELPELVAALVVVFVTLAVAFAAARVVFVARPLSVVVWPAAVDVASLVVVSVVSTLRSGSRLTLVSKVQGHGLGNRKEQISSSIASSLKIYLHVSILKSYLQLTLTSSFLLYMSERKLRGTVVR